MSELIERARLHLARWEQRGINVNSDTDCVLIRDLLAALERAEGPTREEIEQIVYDAIRLTGEEPMHCHSLAVAAAARLYPTPKQESGHADG